jgi:hypothetical protein
MACEPRDLDADDFRSVVSMEQIPDTKAGAEAAPNALSGRSFVVYTLSGSIREVTFTSPGTARIRTARERSLPGWTLKEGQLCLGTDCQIIRRWDERRYLAFDTTSKIVSAWWVEK